MIRFGLVGFAGILVDYAVTILLKEYFDVNKYVSNSAGFICAASGNYYLNRHWTFKSKNALHREYAIFVLVSIMGLLLNNLFIYLLNDRLFQLNYYLAKFMAILIVFNWNFFINYKFNFKSQEK